VSAAPYLKHLDEDEFDRIFDEHARKLWAWKRKTRKEGADALVRIGPQAIPVVLFVVECEFLSEDESEQRLERVCDQAMDIFRRMGPDAIPVLEEYTDCPGCLININEFAQEAIFEVLGLDEDQRKDRCVHFGRYLLEEENVWECACCKARFENLKGERIGKRVS
jgi:hypothetical protein